MVARIATNHILCVEDHFDSSRTRASGTACFSQPGHAGNWTRAAWSAKLLRERERERASHSIEILLIRIAIVIIITIFVYAKENRVSDHRLNKNFALDQLMSGNLQASGSVATGAQRWQGYVYIYIYIYIYIHTHADTCIYIYIYIYIYVWVPGQRRLRPRALSRHACPLTAVASGGACRQDGVWARRCGSTGWSTGRRSSVLIRSSVLRAWL